jgi:hypothetical protein
MASTAASRSFRRSTLRGYSEEINRLGLMEEILRRVPPQVAVRLRAPDKAPAWVAGDTLDDILIVLVALRGREAARELGYRLWKGGGMAVVLAPIISVTLQFFGADPASLLSRAQTMASVVSEGIQLRWERTGPSAGTIKIVTEEPMPDSSWAAWEGALSYVFDVTGTTGEISPARPAPDDRCGEVRISWTASGRQPAR